MPEMGRKEASGVYSDLLQTSITKAAKKTFSDMLQNGFEYCKDNLKNNSFVFIVHVLANSAHNGTLDDLFDRSIEQWTQF